jgi:oligoribonuclease NrnB/cAMP/cGMP phosphodiesterase (DHH superfamily)
MSKEPLIIHHAGCTDGICGATIIWLGLGGVGELMAAQYGDEPPSEHSIAGRDVWIVDFSYPRETLVRMDRITSRLTVLDHHKTAQDNCKGLDFCTFDMERSGAMLAHERMTELGWRSRLQMASGDIARYVEDRDLWKWDLPASRAVNAWLGSWPRDLETWLWIFKTYLQDEAEEQGEAILRRDKQLVDMIARGANQVGDTGVWLVNTPMLQSEVGEELVSHGGRYAMMWHQCEDGRFRYSLRSRGNVDVAEIAAGMGGGGHPAAAGFSSKYPPWELDRDGFSF